MAASKKTPGRARGGRARAKALSSEERKAIAMKGVAARWPKKATHRGNFKEEFGIDVECFVLDDEHKTAVITKTGMGTTLALSRGPGLIRLLEGARISLYVTAELTEKIKNPLVFKLPPSRPNMPSAIGHGYDVTILIDICKAILRADADGALLARHAQVVKQAQIVLSASAKAGIKGLVYALAGYDATKADVINSYKLFLREEAREYETEFPDELYEEWYRIYGMPKPKRNRPWKFMHLTVNHVYIPLARSNGIILESAKTNRSASKIPGKRLHQFLSEIGVKTLRRRLGQVLGIAQVSADVEEYERNIARIFETKESK